MLEGIQLCACGNYKLADQEHCLYCGKTFEWWNSKLSLDYLKEKLKLKEEREQAIKLEQERKTEERQAEQERILKERKDLIRKWRFPIAVMICILIIAFIIAKVVITTTNNNYYSKGRLAFEQGNYELAIEYLEKDTSRDESKKLLEQAKAEAERIKLIEKIESDLDVGKTDDDILTRIKILKAVYKEEQKAYYYYGKYYFNSETYSEAVHNWEKISNEELKNSIADDQLRKLIIMNWIGILE